MKDFTLSIGKIKIYDYQSNIEVYFWKNGNNYEANNSFCIYFDNCIDFSTQENVDSFINDFEHEYDLPIEDKRKLIHEISSYISCFSCDY